MWSLVGITMSFCALRFMPSWRWRFPLHHDELPPTKDSRLWLAGPPIDYQLRHCLLPPHRLFREFTPLHSTAELLRTASSSDLGRSSTSLHPDRQPHRIRHDKQRGNLPLIGIGRRRLSARYFRRAHPSRRGKRPVTRGYFWRPFGRVRSHPNRVELPHLPGHWTNRPKRSGYCKRDHSRPAHRKRIQKPHRRGILFGRILMPTDSSLHHLLPPHELLNDRRRHSANPPDSMVSLALGTPNAERNGKDGNSRRPKSARSARIKGKLKMVKDKQPTRPIRAKPPEPKPPETKHTMTTSHEFLDVTTA